MKLGRPAWACDARRLQHGRLQCSGACVLITSCTERQLPSLMHAVALHERIINNPLLARTNINLCRPCVPRVCTFLYLVADAATCTAASTSPAHYLLHDLFMILVWLMIRAEPSICWAEPVHTASHHGAAGDSSSAACSNTSHAHSFCAHVCAFNPTGAISTGL